MEVAEHPPRTLPAFARPVSEIIADLRKPVPAKLIKQRKQGGADISYIEWHTACRLLDSYAPGWEGKVTRIEYVGVCVVITYAITIHAEEGALTREATGHEKLDEFTGYGDPFSNAEAMAFKRAAAKWGVAVHLYDKG
jgi:hypothetical protein